MSTFLSDSSTISNFEKLLELENFDSENFCELTRFLELDPKSDFQYADLRDVDFSNCDLTNYTFIGSDLRGSHGINVKMPSLQNLEGANTSESVFSNYYETETYLNLNPKTRKDISRNSNDDALGQSQWILDVSREAHRSKEELSAITNKLFSETKFHSVKNSVLYGSMRFLDKAEFKKFLFHLFATEMENEETIKITLLMLSRMFPNDSDAIKYPLAIIRSEQRLSLLDSAVSSIASSNHYTKFRQLVRENICSDKRYQFRQYLVRKSIGSSTAGDWPLLYRLDYRPFTEDIGRVEFIDFAESISEETLLSLAVRAGRREMLREQNRSSKKTQSMDLKKAYDDLLNRKLTEGAKATGITLVANAFKKFYAHTGLKYSFDKDALMHLSPKRKQYENSGEFYNRVKPESFELQKWSSAATFF